MFKSATKSQLSLAAAILLASTQAMAVEPAAVPVGVFSVYPTLAVSTGVNDNFLNSSGAKLDTWVTTISPSIQAVAEQGANSYVISYNGSKGLISSSSDDNYFDQSLNLQTRQVLNRRHQYNLGMGYSAAHEGRGTGLSRGNPGLIPEPIQYHVTSYYGGYTLGAAGAQGMLNLTAGYDRTVYDNLRLLTIGRDNRAMNIGAEFLFSVSPRTQMAFELRQKETDYISPATLQDNTDNRYLVGLNWEATGKTTGRARVGIAKKDFENPLIGDVSRTSWELGVNYAWKPHSTFDFSTLGQPNESGGVGNYIDSSTYELGWNHAWSDRFSTVATVTYAEDDYDGVGIEDQTTSFKLGGVYNMRRWMDLSLDVRTLQVDSTAPTNEYEQNVVTLTAQFSL